MPRPPAKAPGAPWILPYDADPKTGQKTVLVASLLQSLSETKAGDVILITDTSFVADFNDATSSVVVEKVCVGNPPMASFGTPPSPAPVVLYRNENFGGSEQWFKEGSFDQNQLSWVGNNTVSSLRVHPGYSVTLYKDSGFRGESITFTGDASFVGSGFNDTTSSLRVSRIP